MRGFGVFDSVEASKIMIQDVRSVFFVIDDGAHLDLLVDDFGVGRGHVGEFGQLQSTWMSSVAK